MREGMTRSCVCVREEERRRGGGEKKGGSQEVKEDGMVPNLPTPSLTSHTSDRPLTHLPHILSHTPPTPPTHLFGVVTWVPRVDLPPIIRLEGRFLILDVVVVEEITCGGGMLLVHPERERV